MSPHSVEVLETKLDILIADFQAHRSKSVKQEDIVRINGILALHSVIGGFTFTIISAYIISIMVN